MMSANEVSALREKGHPRIARMTANDSCQFVKFV
jgi:hypothetical protein